VAASAGIPLAEVDPASKAKQAASGVGRQKAQVLPTSSAKHKLSAKTRATEETTRRKQPAPVGATHEWVHLIELLPEEHKAATVIATMCRGRLARKVFGARRAQRRASTGESAAVAGTWLVPPAEDEPTQELAPLQSAARLAIAPELRSPSPPPLPDKVRAAPQLPSVNDLTDNVGGAATALERMQRLGRTIRGTRGSPASA
jgi:hypothetical protein